MNVLSWITQASLAAGFVLSGLEKLAQPTAPSISSRVGLVIS
ncbi:hypothetical protein ACFWYW_44385 [Nonomuraea sp. NPDC059023]